MVSPTSNAAYLAFGLELQALGASTKVTAVECREALARAAQEPRFRRRLGRGELLNDRGLEAWAEESEDDAVDKSEIIEGF